MNTIKTLKKQSFTITTLLLLSIGLFLSCNTFADPSNAPFATKAELQGEVDKLQSQINNLPLPPVYEIGDLLPDNSIVFYVDDLGEHGLSAWPIDEDEKLNWYEANKAADARGFGWHLPTNDELHLLNAQQNVVNGLDGDYWSATEASSDFALIIGFGDSQDLGEDPKSSSRKVRAVKTF